MYVVILLLYVYLTRIFTSLIHLLNTKVHFTNFQKKSKPEVETHFLQTSIFGYAKIIGVN